MKKRQCKSINPNYQHDMHLNQKLRTHQEMLFLRYSKLLMLRVDFAYIKTSYEFKHSDVNTIVGDMVKLLQRSLSIGGLVGYVWVLEYTEDHGFHIHAAFYLNGQKHRKTWNAFLSVTELWDDITDDAGYTHWCNPLKYYDVQGERVTSWDNNTGRDDMLYILSYLSKKDQKTDKIIFQCSDIPSQCKSGGRNRNKRSSHL